MFLTFYSYAAIILFLGGSIYQAMKFARMPLHGRLELYPVPKEAGKQRYGGSYFEELAWWQRPRQISHGTEIKEMLKEMLLIKKLFENQQKLWWFSYALHLGIYCLAAWTVLLVILAAAGINGINVTNALGIVSPVKFLAGLIGCMGFILATFGAGALLIRRIADTALSRYSTPQEYCNLLLIVAVLVTGIWAWGMDFTFVGPRMVMEKVLTLRPLTLNGIDAVHIILLGIMFIYIPLSKMSHYIGKYFTFHKVLWENEPNIAGNKVAQAVEQANAYHSQTTWAAPHTNSNGRLSQENKN